MGRQKGTVKITGKIGDIVGVEQEGRLHARAAHAGPIRQTEATRKSATEFGKCSRAAAQVRRLFAPVLLTAKAQTVTKVLTTPTADTGRTAIQKYYRLALQYKDGNGVPMDYAKAYFYFGKAVDLGDAQSTYALGYMHYKGLGCTQDYALAANLFRQGAYVGQQLVLSRTTIICTGPLLLHVSP